MTRSIIANLFVVLLCAQVTSAQQSITPTSDALPGTKKLELTKPLHEVMVHGISQFAEQELQAARKKRTAPWLSAEDPDAAKKAARGRLREMIGAVDPLIGNPGLWITGDNTNNDLSGDAPNSVISTLMLWQVAEGISMEARVFTSEIPDVNGTPSFPPKGKFVVLLQDPGESIQANSKVAERIARSGVDVVCPVLVNRGTEFSMHPDIRRTNMTHREYIYRLGFNLGRHVIGYEVERTLALIEMLKSPKDEKEDSPPIVLVGIGEGAVIAQYVAALAPDKFDAVVLHGYFGPRENVWQEPIYRNVWKQLTEFGDAEIASLIAPTPLIIEAGKSPEVAGPPEPKPGQAKIAAPGAIKSPQLSAVKEEFERAKKYYTAAGHAKKLHLIEKPSQVCGRETIAILNKTLGLMLKNLEQESLKGFNDQEVDEELYQAQQKRLVGELVRHTQMLLASSDKVRAKLWKDVDRSSVEAWEKQSPEYREMVYDSFIGKLDHDPSDPNPRSRKVIDEPTHVGYEVVLDLYASKDWSEENPGVIAGGILLLPKDLKKGEKRPVVVCQHGLEGVPMDTITLDETLRAFRAYKGFATQLVKQGFIVYAPQNPYKGFDDFRVLQRKSNPLGRSLFSYIIPQHQQTLNWLASLDYVDPERIAFYGLSYGGKTAVRVPPLLPGEAMNGDVGYCLSICSADFNEWIRKNASAEDRYSYIYTPEYEIFEWNMGHIANYAELSWLMAPRPFMVERGHDDGVAPDEWVGWEFAKVRRHYTKLGIKDQAEIEWFDGPHSINGDGTFKFLHRHLNWPEAN